MMKTFVVYDTLHAKYKSFFFAFVDLVGKNSFKDKNGIENF